MSDDTPATQEAELPSRSVQSRSIMLLSGTSGYFDAFCFLRLKQIFPANMTGNTVLLGIALGQADWVNVLLTASAVISFCVGALLANLLLTHHQSGSWTVREIRMLGVEWGVMLLLSLIWFFTLTISSLLMITLLLVILASLVMGIQSAIVMSLGIPGVATTYITGTLTSLMGGLSDWLRPGHAHPHAFRLGWPQTLEPTRLQIMGRQAGTWCAYVLGAVCGSITAFQFSWLVSWLPLLSIGLVILHACRRLYRRL